MAEPWLKYGAIAVALGAATWLLTPLILPANLPPDFPKLPDLSASNKSTRELLGGLDRDARRHPRSAEVVGKLAMAYHANLLLDQAATAYRMAARLAPADYQWVYCQAFLAEETGNQAEQVRLLEETLRLKPDHIPSLLKFADASFKLGKLDEAEQAYLKASKTADSIAALQAASGLSRIAASRQDWAKVIEYSTPLTGTYPFFQPPFELLQRAYEAQGQRDKAAEVRQASLTATIKVAPPVEDPLNDQLANLSYSSTRLLKYAGLLNATGHPDRAIEVARRAAQAEPTDADARHFIARALLNTHPDAPASVEEALSQLADGLRLKPSDPVPLFMFAQDFFLTPKSPAAIERLAALMQPYGDRADAHLYMGRLAGARGDFAGAVSEFQAALKNDPGNSGVYDELGLAMDKAGRAADALGYFRKAIEVNPMNATAHYNLGRALVERGNDRQGLQELAESLRLKPAYAAARFAMGFALLNLRKFDEAVSHLRDGLRLVPRDAEAHYGLGAALAMQHKRDEAIAELREALKLRPNYPEAQELLGQLQR